MTHTEWCARACAMVALADMLGACGGEEEDTAGTGNRAPVIAGTPPTSASQDAAYAFTPSATDADGDALLFGIEARPAWATFDTATGQLAGTPTSANVGTHRGIVIRVSDGRAQALLPAFDVTVVAAPAPNRAPTIAGTPPTSVMTGALYTFAPTASDADGDALTFSIRNRPGWATFDAATGLLRGTPGAAGSFANVTISVSDGRVAVALATFTITVTPTVSVNRAPVISGTPPIAATMGVPYAFHPTASDPDGNALTFAIVNRPAWAVFNGGTGALTGTPTSAGTFSNIAISVSDGSASASLPAFAITVAAQNTPPTISGSPSTTATVGTMYTFTPTASDVNGETLTFSIVNQPSWATFTSSTGRLQGTPTSANIGPFNDIVISVSDGQASVQLAPFAITVSNPPNRAPSITGVPPSAVMQGTAYAFQPSASDPDGDTLTFTVANAPAWASFSTASGGLAGTPGPQHVGTTSGIVITVSDGTLTASLPAFAVTVQAVATGSATLTWTPPTLNTDGSPLTNLAGYRIYWGTQQGAYPNSVTLNNAGLATYVVSGLAPGTYFFVATAVNTMGVESAFSGVASKTIQ